MRIVSFRAGVEGNMGKMCTNCKIALNTCARAVKCIEWKFNFYRFYIYIIYICKILLYSKKYKFN